MVQELADVKADAEFGRSLRRAPVQDIVFKVSPVPDFRFDTNEDFMTDAANRVRYQLYLRRLSMLGADPVDMRFRTRRRSAYAIAR